MKTRKYSTSRQVPEWVGSLGIWLTVSICATLMLILAHQMGKESVQCQPAPKVKTVYQTKPADTIRTKIIKKAREYGVDEYTALAIATCESQMGPKAKNNNSSASGVLQITYSTFIETVKRMGKDYEWAKVFDEDVNIEVGLWLMSENEFYRWNASKECWG